MVWATLMALLLGVLFAGVTATTIFLWATEATYTLTNPVVDLAFFSLGMIIVAGLASQIRGRQVAGLQQAILALAALAMSGWLGDRIEPFVGGVGLLAAVLLLVGVHPHRRLLTARAHVSPVLLGLATVAAVPAVLYAADMLDRARAAGPSCFAGQCVEGDRYAEAAALAMAVVLIALLASARTAGWSLPAWSAGVSAMTLGIISLGLPTELGALPGVWAAAAVIWGGALVTIATRTARRHPGPHRAD